MFLISKFLCCCLFIIYFENSYADYANSTITRVRMISDDFQNFQKTGKRIGRREGRLISFDTRNNNIEVNNNNIRILFDQN